MATARRRRKAPAKQRYVHSLDGFRALCALGVIAYHMRLPWCQGGLLGVTILFVLSGYLVTGGLMREYGTSRGHIDLKAFFARRFWRLMPTVVVFVAITGAICAIISPVLFTKMRPDILPGLLMVINWTKILGNESYFAAAGAPSPLTHFWSLAIEAQFYLIWPPVLYFLMRRRVRRKNVRRGLLVATLVSAVLMAVLYVPGGDPSRSYYGTDTRAMSLLLGCWLAIVWPFGKMSRRRASNLKGIPNVVVSIVGPLCTVALICMMLFTEGYSSFSYYGGILLCSLLSVGAIASLVPDGGWLAQLLSLRPFAWIGERSYAIYLWHYPILELMNPLTATTGIPWWKLLLELALILVVSDLSYRFVEVPLRSIGKGKKLMDKVPMLGDKLSLPALAPTMAMVAVGAAITIGGLILVEPVTVAGDNPNEKRVMQASLRKPIEDGVYDVVLIGDSVSLGANEQLNEAFPRGLIDTRGEREPAEAIEVLEGYLDQGVVGNDVVISIGTNGILDSDVMDTFLKDVGPDRQLWFVNMRSPNAKDIDNNAIIDEYVADNENVHLIDWHSATEGNDDWLIEDGIHLTWDGRDAYAKLVVDTMDYEVPDETNSTYEVTVLGDTVCLDAADELAKAFPMGLIDTAEGRLPADVASTYKKYAKQDVVGTNVVVCIGSDDVLKEADLNKVIDAVGKDKSLWLVNVRMPGSWCAANNSLMADAAKKYDNVTLVDWYAASEGHDDWFKEDGTHLTSSGAKAYANAIAEAIPKQEKRSSESSATTDENTSATTTSQTEQETDSESSDEEGYSEDETAYVDESSTEADAYYEDEAIYGEEYYYEDGSSYEGEETYEDGSY